MGAPTESGQAPHWLFRAEDEFVGDLFSGSHPRSLMIPNEKAAAAAPAILGKIEVVSSQLSLSVQILIFRPWRCGRESFRLGETLTLLQATFVRDRDTQRDLSRT